jgi:glutathione S-transferase
MLKFYFDWVCQPSRALYILMKINGIPFEPIVVSLKNSEHEEESFKEINRFQKLPCIVDEEFRVSESCAILR